MVTCGDLSIKSATLLYCKNSCLVIKWLISRVLALAAKALKQVTSKKIVKLVVANRIETLNANSLLNKFKDKNYTTCLR
jgi:hypothetical protein